MPLDAGSIKDGRLQWFFQLERRGSGSQARTLATPSDLEVV